MAVVEEVKKYAVLEENLVKEFETKEEAERFKNAWEQFKGELDSLKDTWFKEWGYGLKINIQWEKKEG